MFATNGFPLMLKKIAEQNISFSWEIALALLVKFLLLGGLWWLFFAGNKQPVDEAVIAGKLFGEQRPIIISEKNQESLQ
jgi:hypothetical protein